MTILTHKLTLHFKKTGNLAANKVLSVSVFNTFNQEPSFLEHLHSTLNLWLSSLKSRSRGYIKVTLHSMAALMNKACFKIIKVRITPSEITYFYLVSSLQEDGLSVLIPTVFKHMMMQNKNFWKDKISLNSNMPHIWKCKRKNVAVLWSIKYKQENWGIDPCILNLNDMWMWTACCWFIMQQVMVIPYWCFRTTYWSQNC